MSLSISVAMCTYNGERYVQEQLESILKQDRLPDELIIVDDQSKDKTIRIVRDFAQTCPFLVKILENEGNLGSTKSFERAVTSCSGDIIVFADQDDVWYPDRLLKTEAYFLNNPTMDAVFSDADIIDDDSVQQGKRIWEEVQFTQDLQKEWLAGEGYKTLFSGYIVTGATMAIRRSVLPLVVPFPTHVPILIHDAWIALIMALHGRIGFITEPLISYRMHTQQQVGFKPAGPKVTLRDRFTRGRDGKLVLVQKKADRYKQLFELLNSRTDIDKRKIHRLERLKNHFAMRVNLSPLRIKRVWPVLREMSRGNYQLIKGRWWLTVFGDLFEA